MSDLVNQENTCSQTPQQCPSIKLQLEAVERDLGGFSVRRFLPGKSWQTLGPLFSSIISARQFSHLARGIDVRPHPHIGLATVTSVFPGEILHRDSLRHV